MKFGVVLPIWQLSVREAETLALRAEEPATSVGFGRSAANG
jgi:hypothetical protein